MFFLFIALLILIFVYLHTFNSLNESTVLSHQCCAGDKMEKNEMGWACGVYG